MKLKSILTLMVTLSTAVSLATEGKEGGGGDPLANDFLIESYRISSVVEKMPAIVNAQLLKAKIKVIEESLDGKNPLISFPDSDTLSCFGSTKIGCVENDGSIKIARRGFIKLNDSAKIELVALELFNLAGVVDRYPKARLVANLASAKAGKRGLLKDNDPRFSFSSVETAFASATAPSAAQISSTKWMLVGTAVTPLLINDANPGYWPTGETTIGLSPLTYFVSSYKSTQDALGQSIILRHDYGLDASSRKPIGGSSDYVGRLSSQGYEFMIPPQNNACGEKVICKLASPQQMLICRHEISDTIGPCSTELPKNSAAYYYGYTEAITGI